MDIVMATAHRQAYVDSMSASMYTPITNHFRLWKLLSGWKARKTMSTMESKDYEWVTREMFEEELEKLIGERSDILLSIPGIYEVLSEHFNNEILERLEEKRKDE